MLTKIKDIYLKPILKYILIFITTVFILFSALTLTAKIPKSAIEENLKESVEFFKQNSGVEELLKRRNYTFIHYYADSIILNIIYCIDSTKPVQSSMWANYYEEIKADINNDYITVVEEQKKTNQQYLRYWHGSMAILRPLLTILNIEQIYLLNKIVMYLLAIILFILLFKKSKKLAIIYLLAMIMIAFPIVPFCLEYSWTFYIMLITSIIAIQIEKRGDKGLFVLFFITGILTCFFDFLTTEIITILVPVLLVLFIRKEENRITSFKEASKFLLKSCVLWGIAYITMWFSKWILASIILNINAIDYVKDEAMFRINGVQGIRSKKEMYLGALFKNWHALYPINIIKRELDLWKMVAIFLVAIVASLDWKNIKNKWFSMLMLIVGLIPYIRYLVLANHSYRHSFFTFRSQIITIIAIAFIIIDCLNYKLLFKKINIRRK